MKNFIRVFLVTSIPYSFFMGVFYLVRLQDFLRAIKIALISGVGVGLFMAIFIGLLINSPLIKKSMTPAFETDEQIIHEGPANHFKGMEGVGGWLFLTSRRIVFKSHLFNVQRHTFSLPRDQIHSVEPARMFGVISNGLRLKTKDGRIETFVVEDHLTWSSKISSALQVRPQ